MFQTNSMVARRELMDEYPPFYYHSPVGDYPLQIYMGMCGKIHYIDRFMVGVPPAIGRLVVGEDAFLHRADGETL